MELNTANLDVINNINSDWKTMYWGNTVFSDVHGIEKIQNIYYTFNLHSAKTFVTYFFQNKCAWNMIWKQ